MEAYSGDFWIARLLLQGDRQTLKLLRSSPFGAQPPQFVRARFFLYRFTAPEEKRKTGAWWKRTFVGDCLEPVNLSGWIMPRKYEPGSFAKGTMLFDGDCGFCRKWVRRWERATGGRVRYEPYQKVLERFPEVDEAKCREAVQLILRDGSVCSGAHAVIKALAIGGKSPWLLRLYERSRLFRLLADWMYKLIGRHRTFFRS